MQQSMISKLGASKMFVLVFLQFPELREEREREEWLMGSNTEKRSTKNKERYVSNRK